MKCNIWKNVTQNVNYGLKKYSHYYKIKKFSLNIYNNAFQNIEICWLKKIILFNSKRFMIMRKNIWTKLQVYIKFQKLGLIKIMIILLLIKLYI